MNLRLAGKFALRNIAANRFLEVPFVLSSSLMLIIFNIMSSLLQNDYVNTRHASLPIVISFGIVVTAIFAFIFILYANQFLIRRRNKEFALYGILGLEKKHIRRVIFIEQFIQFALILMMGIIGGFVIGKLSFLWLNRLLNDEMGRLMDYPFSTTALVHTLMFTAFTFVFVYILNISRIHKASPIELLQSVKKGEKEPRVRISLLALGIILLAAGYYIALTTEGTVKSLGMFFVAALIVILASYTLFISLSIAILKYMKKKPSFYTDKKFLSISGMLYRMKSNAVSLASIAVLSTGVMVALSTTWTIYNNINALAKGTMDRSYSIEYQEPISAESMAAIDQKLMDIALGAAPGGSVEDAYFLHATMLGGVKQGEEILPLREENFDKGVKLYMLMYPVSEYNQKMKKNETLAEDEILLSANTKLLHTDRLTIDGKNYKARMVEDIVPANLGVEAYVVIVPDFKVVESAASYYQMIDFDTREFVSQPITSNLYWNVSGVSEDEVLREMEKLLAEENIEFLYYNQVKSMAFELNGGFLFLGCMIGLLFLTGTVLIIYYKQVSEGSEDREKIQIMKKIGLPNKLIKKTAEMQIIWLFFLPLAVSALHALVASKIISQLLGLFGVRSYGEYGFHLGIVVLIFAAIYLFIFKITSHVYYRIVR